MQPNKKWQVDEDAWEKELQHQEAEHKKMQNIIKNHKTNADRCFCLGFICAAFQCLGMFILGSSYGIIKCEINGR